MTSPSPNELWDTDPQYQDFVADAIVPKMLNNRQSDKRGLTSKMFADYLGSPKVYEWFFLRYRQGYTAETPRDPNMPTDEDFRYTPGFRL